jgi:hypothetical protein
VDVECSKDAAFLGNANGHIAKMSLRRHSNAFWHLGGCSLPEFYQVDPLLEQVLVGRQDGNATIVGHASGSGERWSKAGSISPNGRGIR